MADGAHQEKPISLFYSYSHRDEAFRGELEAHLSFLRRSKLIAEWHDRMIGAGDEWKGQIDRQLAEADIILLLVSADFIASDYCWGEEMTKALARHQLGEAKVIPVILRPCRWHRTPLGSLQAVPKDGRPVSEWPNHDAAFDEIATAIERTIADLQQQRRRAGEQAQQQAQEARKRAEDKARQAAEEQQREQDEAQRAVEAEAARVPKRARARGQRRLKLITAVALVILAGFAGVFTWQRWPPHEQPPAAEIARRGEEKAVVAPPAPAPAPTRRALKPLDTFTDCTECPEMVVIPAGSFMMGSPANEQERYSDEGPQRRVTIGPFAIGKTEVTFAQWDACVTAARCNGYKPPDEGWGPGSRPVVNVSWKDAKAYVSWLSQHTGKPYRLPSEAEWEYAARAGTTTSYAFGDAITPKNANYSESKLGKTTEVGAYPPNAWGLYDMHGNVWEWVEDIYHDSYTGAPTDGTAWIDIEGENSSRGRVGRGGAWDDYPGYLRSAARGGIVPVNRNDSLGFRVARTLD